MASQNATQPETRGETDVLGDRPLIVASNRGPVTFTRERDGKFSSRKGSAAWSPRSAPSLVIAKPIWVACPMDDGDRLRARAGREGGEVVISPPGDNPDFRVRFVVPDQARLSPLLQRDQQSPALVSAALSVGHSALPGYHR